MFALNSSESTGKMTSLDIGTNFRRSHKKSGNQGVFFCLFVNKIPVILMAIGFVKVSLNVGAE